MPRKLGLSFVLLCRWLLWDRHYLRSAFLCLANQPNWANKIFLVETYWSNLIKLSCASIKTRIIHIILYYVSKSRSHMLLLLRQTCVDRGMVDI